MDDKKPRHCDDYIMDLTAPNVLRWWLFVNRLPAIDQMLCHQNGVQPKLFATFQGRRVRVTMASRLGDVGITNDLKREMGYEERVPVEMLSDFSAEK